MYMKPRIKESALKQHIRQLREHYKINNKKIKEELT